MNEGDQFIVVVNHKEHYSIWPLLTRAHSVPSAAAIVGGSDRRRHRRH